MGKARLIPGLKFLYIGKLEKWYISINPAGQRSDTIVSYVNNIFVLCLGKDIFLKRKVKEG